MLLQLDRGFTSTVSQLFQRAKLPERHRPYKVGAADLFRSALFSQFGFVNPEASCRGRHKVHDDTDRCRWLSWNREESQPRRDALDSLLLVPD